MNTGREQKTVNTCWSSFLIFSVLVTLVELGEGFCGFLQPRHKDFNVIQRAVQDLLNNKHTPLQLEITAITSLNLVCGYHSPNAINARVFFGRLHVCVCSF